MVPHELMEFFLDPFAGKPRPAPKVNVIRNEPRRDFASEVESDIRENDKGAFIEAGLKLNELVGKLASAPRGTTPKQVLSAAEFKKLCEVTEELSLRPEVVDSVLVDVKRRLVSGKAQIESVDFTALCEREQQLGRDADAKWTAFVEARNEFQAAGHDVAGHSAKMNEHNNLIAAHPVITGDATMLAELYDKQHPAPSRHPLILTT